MASPDYVGPTAARAAILPARVIYLVADESESGLRRAVQEACTRWGGMTEPIVSVNQAVNSIRGSSRSFRYAALMLL